MKELAYFRGSGARPIPCSSGGRNRRFTACAAGKAIIEVQQVSSLPSETADLPPA
ncbi:hypothetical protein HQ393_10180 [Chitinibacter bivalviorum]|uniref:Uncharacterized protein n=1 Tax=Chitinibacter bivalviorum TaxID=2739434 RepID=A0A7H9BJD0_9NEIS|nr:hypothetical protein [Chitinibacter bivalviorum]QLG88579.1 hypothetical protein HQ393_10180 [Chitinibacter bivalviorum]